MDGVGQTSPRNHTNLGEDEDMAKLGASLEVSALLKT